FDGEPRAAEEAHDHPADHRRDDAGDGGEPARHRDPETERERDQEDQEAGDHISPTNDAARIAQETSTHKEIPFAFELAPWTKDRNRPFARTIREITRPVGTRDQPTGGPLGALAARGSRPTRKETDRGGGPREVRQPA